MVYPQHRSNVNELMYGMNDGVWKDSHINWANVNYDETCEPRKHMDHLWHGFNESPVKTTPDGRSYTTKGASEIGSNDKDYY